MSLTLHNLEVKNRDASHNRGEPVRSVDQLRVGRQRPFTEVDELARQRIRSTCIGASADAVAEGFKKSDLENGAWQRLLLSPVVASRKGGSSPTMAGGLIYYPGREGRVLVLRPGPKYEPVAANDFERISALPLFAGRKMYLHGKHFLYCIGE